MLKKLWGLLFHKEKKTSDNIPQYPINPERFGNIHANKGSHGRINRWLDDVCDKHHG
jgi:hypothetical protein